MLFVKQRHPTASEGQQDTATQFMLALCLRLDGTPDTLHCNFRRVLILATEGALARSLGRQFNDLVRLEIRGVLG